MGPTGKMGLQGRRTSSRRWSPEGDTDPGGDRVPGCGFAGAASLAGAWIGGTGSAKDQGPFRLGR